MNRTALTSNPSNFTMTLGTARMILETAEQGWPAQRLAEARRVVAYWKKRSARR